MMDDRNNISLHKKAFDNAYDAKGFDIEHRKINFPLDEADCLFRGRGPFPEVYSYYYRRFSAYVIGMLSVEDSHKVLNIGCGRGFEEKNLSSLYRNLDLWSLDISSVMITHAYELECPSNLSIASAEKLPFTDEVFDRIESREVIEHVMSPSIMINEIGRVLKPGGIAVITTENEASVSIEHTISKIKSLLSLLPGFTFNEPYKDDPPSLMQIRSFARSSGLVLERTVWDGAMYQTCGSRLFQWIFRSKLPKIAHYFSRLESDGSVDRLFCDQSKFVLIKSGESSDQKSKDSSISFVCCECRGPLSDGSDGKTCQACAISYKEVVPGVTDFLSYNHNRQDRNSNEFQAPKHSDDKRKPQTRFIGSLGKFISSGIKKAILFAYFGTITSIAASLVLYRIITKKPRLEETLEIDGRFKEYFHLQPVKKQ